MLEYKLYLNQINEMIERIEKSLEGITREKFMKDLNLFDSTVLRLQVIGEAIKNIPFEVKKRNKNVRWKIFSKLRNFISHRYSQINEEIIWDIVLNKILELKEQIRSVK